MKPDHTFDDSCAFGSDRWCAHTLGYSLVAFMAARPQLEADGFPRPDGLIGRTCVADIEAWIARRRKVADADPARLTITGDHHEPRGENWNAF